MDVYYKTVIFIAFVKMSGMLVEGGQELRNSSTNSPGNTVVFIWIPGENREPALPTPPPWIHYKPSSCLGSQP